MEIQKKRLSGVIDVDEMFLQPPKKIQKQKHNQIPSLGIKNSSSDEDILIIQNPTEREVKLLSHLQGAGPDDCLPYTVDESTELVYDVESQDLCTENVWQMVDTFDDEEEVEKLDTMFTQQEKNTKKDQVGVDDEDEVREMKKLKTVVWAFGGYEAVKEMHKRVERTTVFELPKQPLYTILTFFE